MSRPKTFQVVILTRNYTTIKAHSLKDAEKMIRARINDSLIPRTLFSIEEVKDGNERAVESSTEMP